MKKIQTKEQRERINKQKQVVIGVVLIFLLVFATAGFAIMNAGSQTREERIIKSYGGFEFLRQDNLWITEKQGRIHGFFYLPEDLKNIKTDFSLNLFNLMNEPLYLVNAETEKNIIVYNLYPEYILRIQEACLSEEDCLEKNLPIKDCEKDNILVFEKSDDETEIYQTGKCIYIVGDTIKGSDKLIQEILDIR